VLKLFPLNPFTYFVGVKSVFSYCEEGVKSVLTLCVEGVKSALTYCVGGVRAGRKSAVPVAPAASGCLCREQTRSVFLSDRFMGLL